MFFRELDIVADMVKDYMEGGYIRFISRSHLALILFTDNQITLVNQKIKEGSTYLYCDATGCVILKIPQQKETVLYYALVLKGHCTNPSIPVAEILSNKHTVPDISNVLNGFSYRKHIAAHKIEADFSWALTHAINISFNRMTSAECIKRAWDERTLICNIHICSAQLMRMVNYRRRDLDKRIRRFIMLVYARLIEAKLFSNFLGYFPKYSRFASLKSHRQKKRGA